MRSNILSKQALLIVIPVWLILVAPLLFNFIQENPTHVSSSLLIENVAAGSNDEQASAGLPMRLMIPEIDVDAAVIPVGLTSDGAMAVPEGPDEVAWYNLGPRPGQIGSAVIAGHYDWKNNLPAVFDYLHTLEVGDRILIEDENGQMSTFIVRETRIYGKDAIAPEVFISDDGKGHLNLITCIGNWNKSEQSFSERLVVFTDKE